MSVPPAGGSWSSDPRNHLNIICFYNDLLAKRGVFWTRGICLPIYIKQNYTPMDNLIITN